MNILVLNNISYFHKENRLHYSLMKGFNLTKAFVELGHTVYFSTKGKEEIYNNVLLYPYKNINKEFLENINLILFIRETTFEKWLNLIPDLKELFMLGSKNRKQIIGIRTEKPTVLFKRKGKKQISADKSIINNFNFICAQSPGSKECAKNMYSNNIIVNRQGSIILNIDKIKEYSNPYLNYDYCVDDFTQLDLNKALFPLPFISEYRIKPLPCVKKQKRLVYTGRLKTNKGKIFYTLRDIMKKLGSEYELHLFAGSADLPNIEIKALSSKDNNTKQIIRDCIFTGMDNVYVHSAYKYDDIERWKWFYYADCGLDFSASRPKVPKNKNKLSANCKILDYLSVGLPCITENAVENSFLVRESSGGLIIMGIGTIDTYCKGIKHICNTNYDRQKIRDYMNNNHSWFVRGKEFIQDINKLK